MKSIIAFVLSLCFALPALATYEPISVQNCSFGKNFWVEGLHTGPVSIPYGEVRNLRGNTQEGHTYTIENSIGIQFVKKNDGSILVAGSCDPRPPV